MFSRHVADEGAGSVKTLRQSCTLDWMESMMRKLSVFESISTDGYFTDSSGDMSWAHNERQDPEYAEFVAGNAKHGGALLLGRKTYELMEAFWPTPEAMKIMPEVAKNMTRMPKLVFSNSMKETSWANTQIIAGDVVGEVRRIKAENGPDVTILGSGSIVQPLVEAKLIDSLQLVVIPIVLGSGRTIFEGLDGKTGLRLTNCRSFGNGNVALSYVLA